MTIPTKEIQALLRQRNWNELKETLDTLPAHSENFEAIARLLWFSDSMVRRRPGDDGIKRDELLAKFGEYYQDRGIPEAVDDMKKMRAELLKIDRGYEEIHSLPPMMLSAKFQPEQRIAGIFSALDYALRQTIRDAENKLEINNGLIDTNRNLLNSEGESYDPAANTHGLSIACGDVLMLEAYREGWFDAAGRIVLPNLDTVSDDVRNATVANLRNANMWRLWKHIDERVRFLGGKLEQFTQELPEWVNLLKDQNPEIDVNVAFEFTPDIASEQFDIIANERFDQILEQNLQKLLLDTNANLKVAKAGDFVELSPKNWVSIDEIHTTSTLNFLTKADISKTSTGPILLSERLRGYAVLKLLILEFSNEQHTYFPRVPRVRLIAELMRCGLVENSANQFIDLATFRRSSRDLYDQPLVKSGDDHFILFGTSLLFANLTKIILSSLANEGVVVEDKGSAFEEATIALLHRHGLNARNLKVRCGPEKDIEFDYDVAFTWDDYVFFLECKNRGIPMGNPIATYRFNQEILSHLKQVQRLRQGLLDHPDILEKNFPEAVGKKVVFCLVNALPYSLGQVNEIFFIDNSILSRFFSSSSMGVSAGCINGTGLQFRTELRKIWTGSEPTASDFIAYITALPQFDIAIKQYTVDPKLEQLSLGAFAKVYDFRRKDLDATAIAQALKDNASHPSAQQS